MVETYAINTERLGKFKGLTAEQVKWLTEDYNEVSKIKGVTEEMLQKRMERLANALEKNPKMTRKEFDELRNKFRIWTYDNAVPTKEGQKPEIKEDLASALNEYLKEANVKKEIKENFTKALDEYLKEVSKLKGRGVYLSPKHMEWIWEDYKQFAGKEGVSQDKLNERTEKLIDALIENPNMTKKEFDELRGSVIHPWEVEGVIVKKKPVRLPKKEIEEAEDIANKIIEAASNGDFETVDKLLPSAGKGWIGGARGVWVSKDIAIIQSLHNKLSKKGKKIKVDGIYGEETEEAIKALQKWIGVKVDGYYGKEAREGLIAKLKEEWKKLEKKEKEEEQKQEKGGEEGRA